MTTPTTTTTNHLTRWADVVKDQGLILAHLKSLKLLTGRKMTYILTTVWKMTGDLSEDSVLHLEELADAYPTRQKYDTFIESLTTLQGILRERENGITIDEFKELLNNTIFEIIKNPFKDVTLNRERLSADSISIAREIYLDRNWELMPHLRDSLIDDGFQESDAYDGEILKHLLFPSERHVRGCWCLDMILGYE